MEIKGADLKILTGYKRVGVGVSGGMDSMALLNYLKENGINIVAIHVNHKLRGEESDRDEKFVKSYCEDNNIPVYVRCGDVTAMAKERKESIELAARNFRMSVFYDCINDGICEVIATAHHELDNAETVLMRIFRGTSVSGLIGICPLRDIFVRPFLSVAKREIKEYVKKEEIPYITDSSNADNEFTRNYIRNVILPEIRKRFPEAESSILRLSKSAVCDDEYIGEKVTGGKLINGALYLEFKELTCHRAVASRNIIEGFRKLGIYKDIEQKHIESLLHLKKDNAKQLSMPFNITAQVENGKVVLYKDKEQEKFSYPFKQGSYFVGDSKIIVRPYKKGDKIRFDINKVPKDAVIRNRMAGDNFQKFGGGTKKLNDYLTDIKYPERLRDALPLIACGNEVLVICGVEIAKSVKVENGAAAYTIESVIKSREEE